MAREVQIITWCDACLADNKHAEATERAGLNTAGTPVVIDLCDNHAEEILQPALHAFDTHGRTNAKAPRSYRRTRPAEGPCPECGLEFATTQSLGMHRWRKHGVIGESRQKKMDSA